jgi:hypothetical protein
MLPALKLGLDGFQLRNHPLLRSDPPDGEGLGLVAYDHDIRDATGKLFRFQSHQFRHTVGTRMINLV